eukprot:755733-Hanusia_phi.AAC.4
MNNKNSNRNSDIELLIFLQHECSNIMILSYNSYKRQHHQQQHNLISCLTSQAYAPLTLSKTTGSPSLAVS